MISDVHHVAIAVRDMAAALRFYSEALGLPVVKEGDAPARGARVALIGVGGSYLELVQPVTDGSPFARHIGARGGDEAFLRARRAAVQLPAARPRGAGAYRPFDSG